VQWRALRSEEADTETELDNALAVNASIEVLVQARAPTWHAREWLDYLQSGHVPAVAPQTVAIDPTLQALGLHVVAVIERPGGRRYLLLARPSA
jgi:hypothetical protein